MHAHTYITRFNKIAIQGTPQMAVDKEAICLSRVYSYYFKRNLPLFCVLTIYHQGFFHSIRRNPSLNCLHRCRSLAILGHTFYVQPALTRYLSILFLNTLTLVACTQLVDNLFHTLMVLWENENFLTSNLLCFFTSVKLCPLVILLSLILK